MCRLEDLSQIVHKSCSIYMIMQELAASRLHTLKSTKTRIYAHLIVSTRKCSRVTYRSRSQHISTDHAVFSCPTSTPISTIRKHDQMRFVALCYDVIRSDAMVPIVEAIVLIGKKILAAKKFSTINPIVKIDIKT